MPMTRNAVALLFFTMVCPRPWMSAGEAPVDAGTIGRPVVYYEVFGARGDGQTDDLAAIAEAHAFANRQGLPVKAKDTATYYIGGRSQAVVIQTDTDFGTANFIIDDTKVENHKAHVFTVSSLLKPIEPQGMTSLKRNQQHIGVTLPQDCVLRVTDSKVKHFIRRGGNQNSGASQTDVLIVRSDGRIAPNTPVLWDFDDITGLRAYPMDASRLTISGGRFTTIANREKAESRYFARGIAIRRSNVVIDGLEHRITGEGEQGAPYDGFLNISDCANVTVRNTTLSGHKTYRTIGSAGIPVSMGNYDLVVTRAANISFVNCRQFNDIKDGSRWGIMGSNYCKNLLFEGCELSRFDAHKGVTGATIRRSTLGHAGINVIGSGTLLVEESTVYGRQFIQLRPDYGSTWQGEFVIRNCRFVPACGRPISASLIGGWNDGQHEFGYTCSMPDRITIDGLVIDDSRHPVNYEGPAIFANFNPRDSHAAYEQKLPYAKTREVLLRGVRTVSGKRLRISTNPFMFKDVQVRDWTTASETRDKSARGTDSPRSTR